MTSNAKPRDRPAHRVASWTMLDQGIVSLGNFAVNLALARTLLPTEYGLYSLLFLLMLSLQVVTGSLLFYPIAVRGTVLDAQQRARLFGCGLILLLALCVPLGLILTLVLGGLHHPELIAPALLWLVVGQLQELLRRGLLAEMRHSAAVPGDAVSYFGQAAGIAALAAAGWLTVPNAIFVIAGTSAIAALLQATQVAIHFGGPIRQTASDCWHIGRFSLGSNLVSALRQQIFPWALAALGGTALAASYQASQNLVLAINPIILGLCNVIPQAVARGRQVAGVEHAWRVARTYILFGAVPVFGYCALVSLWPGEILSLFYGETSPYASLTSVARVMAAAAAIAFFADVVCAYLHGIEEARLAMWINTSGLVASIVPGLLLTAAAGIAGSCAGLVVASITRVVAAQWTLTRLVADERRRFA